MASTGEVGCLGRSFDEALLKALLSVGQRVPDGPVLISSGDALQKADLLPACRLLADKGYKIYATGGSCRYLNENGVKAELALWPNEEQRDDTAAALDLIREHKVSLVINIPKNFTHKELTNGFKMRRAAVDFNVPLITNARLASAFIKAFCRMSTDDLAIESWDEF